MKVVAIVQARMGSTRFPGKVMAMLAGKRLIDHVLDRASKATALTHVMVATTTSPADDVLAQHTKRRVFTYRGSEDDVLDRYYQSALACGADGIVRITADCPLIDPSVIDAAVHAFVQGSYDYVSNTIVPTFPDGLDVEVCSVHALEIARRQAVLQSEREHVTPYIWKRREVFRLHNLANDSDLSHLRWTVDDPADLVYLQRLFDRVPGAGELRMQEIIDALACTASDDDGTRAKRNEGYVASLRHDEHKVRKGTP